MISSGHILAMKENKVAKTLFWRVGRDWALAGSLKETDLLESSKCMVNLNRNNFRIIYDF